MTIPDCTTISRRAEELLLETYRPWDIGEVLPWKMVTWNSELPIFEELIKRNEPKRIIEVGSWLGGSAIRMAQICRELGYDAKIICIDTWLGDSRFLENKAWNVPWHGGVSHAYRQFASNVIHAEVQDMIVPFPQTSVLATYLLAELDAKAELIYVDGGHDPDSVTADCRGYWPLCTGTMFGDDYGRPMVGEPVRDFAAKTKIVVEDRTPHWVIHNGRSPAEIREVKRKAEALKAEAERLKNRKRIVATISTSRAVETAPSIISAVAR